MSKVTKGMVTNLTSPNAVRKGGSGCFGGAPPSRKCKSFGVLLLSVVLILSSDLGKSLTSGVGGF